VGTGMMRECTNKRDGKNTGERMEGDKSIKETDEWKNEKGGNVLM
jgi:hypothetical protein